jgi:DnaJ-like protein
LNRGASPDEIRQAYRDLAQIWHPDRFSHDVRLRLKAQEKMKEINGAYEVVRAAMFAAGTDPGPEVNPGQDAAPPEPPPGASAGDPPTATTTPIFLWAALGLCLATNLLLATVVFRRSRGAPAEETKFERPAQSSPDKAKAQTNSTPGAILAHTIYLTADDFVIDVFHNGERVPDSHRQLVAEEFGATSEKISIQVREGDWLVFNVANDRLRWGGAYYFAAAGVQADQTIGFSSGLENGQWSFCDSPRDVDRFIAEPGYMSENKALAPDRPWGRGDALMKHFVPQWQGQPVWGTNRNTWLKFSAPPGGKP